MRAIRQYLPVLLSLLLLALSSCQQSAADERAVVATATDSIQPIEVTGARWITGRPVADLDGGRTACDCVAQDVVLNGLPPPDVDRCTAVCLGARGYLVVKMSALFTNRAGADLFVHEWGSERGGENDPFSVWISDNGHAWTLVADTVTNDEGAGFASIDLDTVHGHFLYVKIVPAGRGADLFDGPEILAIEALHPSVSLDR